MITGDFRRESHSGQRQVLSMVCYRGFGPGAAFSKRGKSLLEEHKDAFFSGVVADHQMGTEDKISPLLEEKGFTLFQQFRNRNVGSMLYHWVRLPPLILSWKLSEDGKEIILD